jgi:hypothetical protein
MVWAKMLLKTTLLAAFAGGFLLSGGVATVRADDDRCFRDVQKWEQRLDRDVYRHGFYSRKANHDRHELAEARESCEHRYGYYWREHRNYDRNDYRR